MVKRASWLSVTPEPERELPAAVATLRCRRTATAGAIAVISNHHNLLLALPGRGARRTESDRRRLSELHAATNEDRR